MILKFVIVVLLHTIPSGTKATAKDVLSSDRILVIAHRGASADAPENTIPAFELAKSLQSDLIELDYYHTKDNVPIVFHDRTCDRTTNANDLFRRKEIPINSLLYKQVMMLDAGMWFDPKFRETMVPSLELALDCIQDGSMTLIERKQGDAQTLIDVLKRKQLTKHVVVQAFDWNYLKDCRKLDSNLVLAALGSKSLVERIDEIQKLNVQAIGWNFKDLTKEDVDRAHQANLKLWVYTVNNEQDVKRMIAWGVDGIITDKPKFVRNLVSDNVEQKSTVSSN